MRYPLPSFAPELSMDALFPSVDLTTDVDCLVRPGQRTLGIDFLDQGYLNILNGIRAWTTDTVRGEKFTSMCYRHQGTTSAWHINVAFNGLSSPVELQSGMQLRFPLIGEIRRLVALNRSSSSPVGARVTL